MLEPMYSFQGGIRALCNLGSLPCIWCQHYLTKVTIPCKVAYVTRAGLSLQSMANLKKLERSRLRKREA